MGRCKLARALRRAWQFSSFADDSFAARAVSAICKRSVCPLWLFDIGCRLANRLLCLGDRLDIVAHLLGAWRCRPRYHRAKYNISHLFIRSVMGSSRSRARAQMVAGSRAFGIGRPVFPELDIRCHESCRRRSCPSAYRLARLAMAKME